MSDRTHELPDRQSRIDAVDPSRNVVLEASAGTGKTRVLVDRYVNLLLAGVDPDHILAITFTRKAAAEMRQRIVSRLRELGRAGQMDPGRWRELRDRLGEIEISTIDAFCLALLREFPLEADVDPGFELADETEVPRLREEALDAAMRICRARAATDEDVALLFAQIGERRLRPGIGALLDRRLVAPDLLRRFLARGPRDLTAEAACRSAADRLAGILRGAGVTLEAFLADGPVRRLEFAMLAADMREIAAGRLPLDTREGRAALRATIDRLKNYFLKRDGEPRGETFLGTPFKAADCVTAAAWTRHRIAAGAIAPAIADAIRAFRRDLNAVMSRGVWAVYGIALHQYERTLEAHALLDFPGVLARALELLRQMEEFAQSRYRLEARYHHVLVDEFQDTSRAQWELIEQLVRSWGEGLGASADAIPPSIFIVGDRKQSIYGFRDADVAMLREAASFIHALRPDHSPRRAISVSFRSTPEILAFVNDVFGAIVEADAAATARRDAFRYDETDRFPDTAGTRERESLRSSASDSEVAGGEWGWGPTSSHDDDSSLGIVTGSTVAEAADAVAGEVEHLLRDGVLVRDRTTGERRPARPADVAILFRSRDSHREFEAALDRRGISTYVYKGLGFFDADEIQDAIALLRFLADPESNLRAASLLRSRLVRLSDDGVAKLAPKLADAIAGSEPDTLPRLSAEDRRVLAQLRGAFPGWLAAADLIAADELLERVLHETAYYLELRGARRLQARENLKKLRSLVRRAQNRGYTTLARIAEHLEQLAVGDESNAAIDAADAVSLMTVHAAKGLEFAVVFLVNLGRGTGGPRAPIRVALAGDGEPAVSVADYQSDADEDAKARDREESKRLLYVALTRARDRLYLSASVVNGDCRMGPGSLGEVLPASLRSVLSAAPGAASAPRATILWTRGGVSAAHRFAAIRRDEREPAAAADGHGCPA